MVDSSRAEILGRVRQAQIRAYIPESPANLPDRLPVVTLEPAALKTRLCEEFKLLGVDTYVEDSETGVYNRVKSLIAGKSVLSWNAEHLPYETGSCLQSEKVYLENDSKDDQGKADIGLTGCETVLAETGTLAMISGPGKPRTASLLPFIHVVIIRNTDIVLGMGEFLEKFKTRDPLPYLTFITGPSRTADIELSLTLGVHGPGKVIAIIGP